MIEKIHIRGFKSIRNADIKLSNLTLLIGANGSGKSNFISFFQFLRAFAGTGFQQYVGQAGGADAILHYGLKRTQELSGSLRFREGPSYKVMYFPTQNNTLLVQQEEATDEDAHYQNDLTNLQESGLLFPHKEKGHRHFGLVVKTRTQLHNLGTYHFDDTTQTSPMKLPSGINDNDRLHSDGANIASFLFLLEQTQPDYYHNIVRCIRLAAPFFDTFVLKDRFGSNTVWLEWREIGSEKIFPPSALSDGTLRFICLATLLMQPPGMLTSTIIIDEPEIGLHPYAIGLLAGLLKKASHTSQLIVATQSTTLVNQFLPEDILVVERTDSATVFKRLHSEELNDWLGEYALGELWEKNIIGGRPSK